MTERRVLVVDDEPLARERIRVLLEAAGAERYRLVAECCDGEEALAAIDRERPDLIFLDVSMPGPDGVEVARSVVDLDPMPAVVFVTAHRQFAVEAFDVSAIDYLVKPVDRGRFAQMLERFERRQRGPDAPPLAADVRAALTRLLDGADRRQRWVVRTTKGHYFVRTEDIEIASADGNYVALTGAGRVHLIRETLKAFEAAVDPSQFVRVHRSTIVNIDFISRIEPLGHGEYRIIMKNGARFESSRGHSQQIRALLR